MKKKRGLFLFTLAIVACFAVTGRTETIVFYGFENGPAGWEVPDWTKDKEDLLDCDLAISEHVASEGKYSFEIMADFEASAWRGIYIQRDVEVSDWSPFRTISVDVYLPEDAPRGFKARLILTLGEEWKWTEMNSAADLTPGEWTVITADLSPESKDWKNFMLEDLRKDVKRLGIRVESERTPLYKGSFFIDNIRLY